MGQVFQLEYFMRHFGNFIWITNWLLMETHEALVPNVFCVQPFPCHIFTLQTHLIFEASYLAHFPMNLLENLYIVFHVLYIDAPTSMSLYFKFVNFQNFMPLLPPVPQSNVLCT